MDVILEALLSLNTSQKIIDLDKRSMLDEYIPCLYDMKEVGKCKYHTVNCFEHSIKALEEFEYVIEDEYFFESHLSKNIEDYLNDNVYGSIKNIYLLKLAIFLHDIGKPNARTVDENGRAHFRNHENIGADISKDICKNIGLSESQTEYIFKMVKYHMILLKLYKENNMSKDILYKYYDLLGDDIISISIMGYCDIVATRKLLYPDEDNNIIKTYMNYMLTSYLYKYKKEKQRV